MDSICVYSGTLLQQFSFLLCSITIFSYRHISFKLKEPFSCYHFPPFFSSQKNSFEVSNFALLNLSFILSWNLLKSNFYFIHATKTTCIDVKINKDLHIAKSNGKFSVVILLDQWAALDTGDSFFSLETLSPGFQDLTLSWFYPSAAP